MMLWVARDLDQRIILFFVLSCDLRAVTCDAASSHDDIIRCMCVVH